MTYRVLSAGRLVAGALAAMVLTMASDTQALPGTHGPSISTWDTRASSVVLAAHPGFLEEGHFFIGSYNANFTSTSGNLSAQFGMHYLNFRGAAGDPVAHGMSGTAVALFSIPTGDRYDNGIPKLAVGYFIGGAPAALISGQLNYLSIPLVTGFALPWSPGKGVTITPWIEVSPGVNLDTEIHDIAVDPQVVLDQYCDPQTGQCTVPQDVDAAFTQAAVEEILREGLEIELGFTVGARAGLDLAFHLSDGFDFKLAGMYGTLDKFLTGTRVIWIGGGLVFRWDDIVPAVLPAERRLLKESCEDIEARFRTCPQSRRWKAPPAPVPPGQQPPAPGTLPPGAPPPTAPAPGAPPPAPGPVPPWTPPVAPPPGPAPFPSPPPAPPPIPGGVAPSPPPAQPIPPAGSPPPLPPPAPWPSPAPQPPSDAFPDVPPSPPPPSDPYGP